MFKSCLNCNKLFERPYNCSYKDFLNERKYCSIECMDEYRRGKPSCSPETTFKKGHTIYSNGDNRKKYTGKLNNKWKGGVSSFNEKFRKSLVYKKWRNLVFERDDYTCQKCGQRGGNLEAHHDLPFSTHKDLRVEILNGETLCVKCHRKTNTYGKFIPDYDLHLS